MLGPIGNTPDLPMRDGNMNSVPILGAALSRGGPKREEGENATDPIEAA